MSFKKFTEKFLNMSGMNSMDETIADASHVTLQGKHEELTRDEHGKFKHPFLSQASDVSSIYYPDSKSLSIKLNAKQPE